MCFMFLSWAGKPLFRCLNQVGKADAVNAVAAAFEELHQLRVLHGDAESRNVLYDSSSSQLMIVDFERAEVRERSPLDPISPNSRKRKHAAQKNHGKDNFATELQFAMKQVSKCWDVEHV